MQLVSGELGQTEVFIVHASLPVQLQVRMYLGGSGGALQNGIEGVGIKIARCCDALASL